MKFIKITILTIISCSFMSISSCTHLTHQEHATLKELKSYGVREDAQEVAKPVLAGGLNILPGFGNFYLASGNGADSSQWLYGALNLVTWPFSIIWGIPEAVIDANSINKRELVYYYNFDMKGKAEFEKLKKQNAVK